MVNVDTHESPPEEAVPFLYEGVAATPPTSRETTEDDNEPSFEIVSALNGKQEPSAIKLRLYISHLLSTWNSRVFEFGSVLFLASRFPGTLLPASIYALVRAASAICLAPMVGRYVDRDDRLKVVRLSIVGQRAAVMLSCLGFWTLPIFFSSALQGLRSLLLGLLAILACVEKLCSIMNLISIERDWVIIIAENSQCRLEVLNSQMRRIDLVCKLGGPLLISLVDGKSTKLAIETVFGMSVLSLLVEYFAIADVYHMIPALKLHLSAPLESRTAPLPSSPRESPMRRIIALITAQIRSIYEGLSSYIHHPVFLPSMALSLLYLTVLSFSGQMVTYLLSVGLTSTQIGLLRTVSTGLEICATWLAPTAMNRIGLLRGGLWFINWQMFCLLGAAACFWGIDQQMIAASILVAGMIASRVGLWGFDLCVQIIVQEGVEAGSRGSFSSLESSLQNFFELCSYAFTIVFARPDQFQYPVMMSVVAVVFASCLYAAFVRNNRGHLLHLSRCMGGKGWHRGAYSSVSDHP